MVFISVLIIVSLCVALLNIFGQFKTLRYSDFMTTPESLFRFGREEPLPYKEALGEISRLTQIDDRLTYAHEATKLVSKSLAHLEWNKLDPLKAYQTVPLWENPVLYLLGRYSGLPYYQRYNFTDYRRTLERGFGICGDASVVLSQLLDKKQIKHQIVAFDEHVLVEIEIDHKRYVLDPDFGVVAESSLKELADSPELIVNHYSNAGFPETDGRLLARILARRSYTYNSVYDFVPKRYLLERISYWLFWYGPVLGVLAGVLLWTIYRQAL
jgi:hypothetical protein